MLIKQAIISRCVIYWHKLKTSNDTNRKHKQHENVVPTPTIGAAFIISIVLGLVVISGVLSRPYEAREVIAELHEHVLMEIEYRELSRISYSAQK